MVKRFLLLSGLSILAVVLNHAAGWGQIAMFWWTDRYLPVTVPDYSQASTFAHYFYIFVREVTEFAVPAFLFISAYFSAYSLKGKELPAAWKIILRILRNLLIPYLIWSVVIFLLEALSGNFLTPWQYVLKLFIYGAEIPLYYVPVLCYLYLLSPLLVWLAQKNAKALLLGTSFFHLALIGVSYLNAYQPASLAPSAINMAAGVDTTLNEYTFPRYIFYFALGITAGLYVDKFNAFLLRFSRWCLPLVLLSGLLKILEADHRFVTGIFSIPRTGPYTISMTLYSLAVIALFLSANLLKPFNRPLTFLGGRTYGIYLTHHQVLTYTSRIFYHFAPNLLGIQALLFPILFSLALGLPLFALWFVRRSPARRLYPYLFG